MEEAWVKGVSGLALQLKGSAKAGHCSMAVRYATAAVWRGQRWAREERLSSPPLPTGNRCQLAEQHRPSMRWRNPAQLERSTYLHQRAVHQVLNLLSRNANVEVDGQALRFLQEQAKVRAGDMPQRQT